MADTRSLRQKLEDMARLGTVHEAERAREALARLDRSGAGLQSPAADLRARIQASPDDTTPKKVVRVRMSSGRVVTFNEDEAAILGW